MWCGRENGSDPVFVFLFLAIRLEPSNFSGHLNATDRWKNWTRTAAKQNELQAVAAGRPTSFSTGKQRLLNQFA
jgi:hypothetical protein